jgi:putative two-component system response regulator
MTRTGSNQATENAMRVLVVEDDDIIADMMANALKEFGYEVTVAENGRAAFALARTGEYRLVVSDWEMPEMSGIELCRQIRRHQWSGYIYVILLTSYSTVDHVVQGLEAGADDFLTKPFQPQELRLRLRVGERILGLESRDLTIFALAKLAESRDEQTGAHLERIREYCRILADELSRQKEYSDRMDGEYVRLIYLTSPLHDIGKVGIPDRVLLKPGRLTPEEFEIMKQHTVIGGETLDAAARVHPEAHFLSMSREIALTHHEWFDGSGYPRGLSGQQIPLSGRITMLADVYDALTSARVYKPAYDHETARALIIKGSGAQFDPDIVAAFLRREDDFVAVCRQMDTAAALAAVPCAAAYSVVSTPTTF